MLESIINLTSLQTFEICLYRTVIPTIKPQWSCDRNVSLWGTIKGPLELSFLPHSVLTDLTLVESKSTEDPMSTLGSLPNLTALDQLINVVD